MFCKSCGNEIDKKTKFCTRCGAPVEESIKSKSRVNKRNIVIGVICIIVFIVMAGAAAFLFGGREKVSTGTGKISLDNDEANKYISEHVGFADNPVYGKKNAHTEVGNGSRRTTYETKINEDSKGGAIYYSTIKTEKYPNGLLCVSISENLDLFTELIYDYKNGGSSRAVGIAQPCINSRCYCIIKGDYFISIELSEDESISDENQIIYKETLTAYNLNDDLEESFKITREIDPNNNGEKKSII